MNIPELGKVTKGKYGGYQSKPIRVGVLGGKKCCFMVEKYDEDPDKEAFHIAIANFLSLKDSALKKAERYVFQYLQGFGGWLEILRR